MQQPGGHSQLLPDAGASACSGQDEAASNCDLRPGNILGESGSDGGSIDGREATRRQDSTVGGWDYVYLRSDDNEVRLIELQDSQERCSTVSTVLGLFGFTATVRLAVPSDLLQPGAAPVIVGNIIELGDWDVGCAEAMSPCELAADGFAFFAGTVCSNYSSEDEVYFRFAILAGGGSGGRDAEILCWEGPFVRRMADCKLVDDDGGGDCFLAFGRPEPLSEPRDLPLLSEPLLLSPGWLTHPGQAALLLRVEPPQFDPRWQRRLSLSPAELRLVGESTLLAQNFRGPLASAPAQVVAGAGAAVRFPAAEDVRAEFAQLVPVDAQVDLRFVCRFDADADAAACVEAATARLPLQPAASQPEEETLLCDLLALVEGRPSPEVVGRLPVRVLRLSFCERCPPEAVRSLDRCGPGLVPPGPGRPIRVDPLSAATAEWAAATTGPGTSQLFRAADDQAGGGKFFELPICVSADGRLQIIDGNGGAIGPLSIPSDVGLVVRIVPQRGAAAAPAVGVVADSALSALLALPTERWAMLAAHDLRLCTALCLKQMRLPVAYVVSGAGEAAAAGDALDACRHYGVRAVVAPAAGITGDLLAAAAARGLALYAYGGTPAPEVAARLEGVFAEGTFAEIPPCAEYSVFY